MFNSKKELAIALVEGRRFRDTEENVELYFDSTYENPFRFGESALVGMWEYYDRVVEVLTWYKDLGEGILCKVWDNDPENKLISIIEIYNPRLEQPYRAYHLGWKNAEPLTKDELMKYCHEVPRGENV